MNDRQENKLTMLDTTGEYLRRDENTPLWQPIAAFGVALTRLDGSRAALRALADIQRRARAGKSTSKSNLNETMILVTIATIGPVAAYANDVGDIPLRQRFSVTRTELDELRDSVRPGAAEALHEEAAEILAEQAANPPPAGQPRLADYGLTAGMLASMHSAIAAYSAVKNAPRDAQVSVSQATDAIELEFEKVDNVVEWGLDKMMQPFQLTHPDFYNGYWIARRIIDAGVRHDPPPPPAPEG